MNAWNKVIILISFIIFIDDISGQEKKDSSDTAQVNVENSSYNETIKDTTDSKNFSIIGYPYVYYSPETQLAFGAGGIILFRTAQDKNLKPSKVILAGSYTTSKDYNLNFGPEMYFPGIKNTFFTGRLKLSKTTGKFYGIGNNTGEITNPGYVMQMFSLNAEISSIGLLFKNIQSGIIYEYSNNHMLDKKDNPFFNADTILGENGGRVGGLGISITFDNRDNIFYPSSGNYLKIEGVFYRKFAGSEYSFDKYILNYRQFWEFIENNFLALQLYSHFSLGNPPFFRLPALGGSYRMRGYYEGRYRDRQYITSQIEYRKIIWWRFGLNLFVSLGDVSDKLSAFRLKDLKKSYGFGIRFVFDETEKVNLRVDFGFTKNSSGIYFALEEAF